MQRGILRVYPEANTLLNPVADGGDGTLEVLATTFKEAQVMNAYQQVVNTQWGVLSNTAVIEMAKVCGLTTTLKPLVATSYGLGQLIKQALDAGFRQFIIGLGGSATVDGGAGMAEALGAQFLDQTGQPIPRGGGALKKLSHIDMSHFDQRVQEARFLIACDVNNPLEEAARIYAPQKGATPSEVKVLEQALTHYAAIIKQDLHKVVTNMPWGGSAGGTGAGAAAFLNGVLTSGIDLILDKQNFDNTLQGADLVIVGEGRLDSQTGYYKAPFGVAQRAKAKNIRVIAIVGSLGPGFPQKAFDAIVPLAAAPLPCEELVAEAAEQAIRLFL